MYKYYEITVLGINGDKVGKVTLESEPTTDDIEKAINETDGGWGAYIDIYYSILPFSNRE